MRLFLLITAILFSLRAEAVTSVEDAASGIPTVTQITANRIWVFLEKFIDSNKSAAEYADFFADGAEYYDHGIVPKAEIVRDVERYTRRWPWRFYRLTKIDYITPDPSSDRVFVSYEIEFEVANASKTVAGKADYGAVIADPDGAPRIEWIKERVGHQVGVDTLEE
jgi:hypothetical protein